MRGSSGDHVTNLHAVDSDGVLGVPLPGVLADLQHQCVGAIADWANLPRGGMRHDGEAADLPGDQVSVPDLAVRRLDKVDWPVSAIPMAEVVEIRPVVGVYGEEFSIREVSEQ